MGRFSTFRDLRVYQELKRLHLEVHVESMVFPKFELLELGSQIRQSSNAAPAALAEGWGSRQAGVCLEAINRCRGEVRETQHHLDIARTKHYLDRHRWHELTGSYESCDRMLDTLYRKVVDGTTPTKHATVAPADRKPTNLDIQQRKRIWSLLRN